VLKQCISSENNLVNIFGFQTLWWLCILFGNLALPATIGLLACHIYFHSQPINELKAILFCGIVGFIVDTLLTIVGVFEFDGQSFYAAASYLPPFWLFILWFGFAATLTNSLSYFRNHLVLASILGGISGAGSYLAAERLNAVIFPLGVVQTSMTLVIVWAILFPVLILISKETRQNDTEQKHVETHI